MTKDVLGVKVDDISEQEALEKVSGWISGKENHKLVFTPGPEFIVEANHDLEFRKILNSSGLNIPDGLGLKFAGVRNRITGVDLMLKLCQLAAENGWKIGLLGGWDGEGEETASKLKQIYRNIKIPLVIDGSEADGFLDSNCASNQKYEPVDILFVGMGHFRQEKLLHKMRTKCYQLPAISFKVGMGVGSSFDLISGRAKRPPKWMQNLGLEWLGRLSRNPRHSGRVFRATLVFSLLLLKKDLF